MIALEAAQLSRRRPTIHDCHGLCELCSMLPRMLPETANWALRLGSNAPPRNALSCFRYASDFRCCPVPFRLIPFDWNGGRGWD